MLPPTMRYLTAILCPPLAVLLYGTRLEIVFNLLLTLCLWVPGVIHAMLVVHSYSADMRATQVSDEMRKHRFASVLRKV